MTEALIVSDWDCESFHREVLRLEARGYVARRETYSVTPEMNPETGLISHLYRVEMYRNGESDLKDANAVEVSD